MGNFRRIASVAPVLLLVALVAAPSFAAPLTCGPDVNGRLADVEYGTSFVVWYPTVEYREMELRITGPCEDIIRTYREGETISFDLREIKRIQDGEYTWELRRVATIDREVEEALAFSRKTGDESLWWELWTGGHLPQGPFADSESFTVVDGRIQKFDVQEGRQTDPASLRDGLGFGGGGDTLASLEPAFDAGFMPAANEERTPFRLASC